MLGYNGVTMANTKIGKARDIVARHARNVPHTLTYREFGKGEIVCNTPDAPLRHAIDYTVKRKVKPKKWVLRDRMPHQYKWVNHAEFDTFEEAVEELGRRLAGAAPWPSPRSRW